ncbi:DEAD/DEAH box helicase [Arthrobacter caoxuetaonis]|uniref:DEAD/DEAH box helicase n=1 Tax=Arthrobacter caoxuetaonis TaxID=2886935 RepID=A0A9X1SD36_9MICC|nr:DEAD/DEAH box helicase [Arthrobacter caoxuetaonis]MCC3298783.1 DEAD/DEAH box helicase [Arthrobacter caoxuetaonis]USQ55867.1 DEAD/DEAH box helicase [Arthrobacter caoxuetaonis]
MTSPSERYQAAKERTGHARTRLAVFEQSLGFDLDPFQIEACRSVEAGRGVLVAAPTGAGKTVVGEFAVYMALERGLKAFYTTPIKALSNQKYVELSASYGPENVGLLTGDTSINPDASVVVMTTEVLRNMLYSNSATLDDLGYVVMDEVHYLADRFRGAVWEEVIIHLRSDVQLVSLSATVSNAEEFGAWLDTVRGDTDVVVTEHRPVPLWQHVMVGRDIVDLFATDVSFDEAADDSERPAGIQEKVKVNPELLDLARNESRLNQRSRWGSQRPGSGGRKYERGRGSSAPAAPQTRTPRASRPQVISQLDKRGLLPAITFIFSRNGCDAAVRQCVDSGLALTTEAERRVIAAMVDEASRDIPEDDLEVLGFWTWREGLVRGFAAHHAGMLPTFKEVVEKLFAAGLVRAVFATETLALGVNMPARSVVLEKLDKFNGEAHVDITAGEYTQLTGRAGRRGIDVEGHAVVLWQPGTDPAAVAGLASRRTYPLNSSFRPTYNMSINLIAQFGRDRAREILESSFAQFQADRSVVGLARQVRSREESLTGYEKAMTCHLGDFSEYSAMRRKLSDLEQSASKSKARSRRSAAAASLETLRPGDVIDVPGGRSPGYAVVLTPDTSAREPRPTILTEDKQIRRLNVGDLDGPLDVVSQIRIPKSFNARTPKDRRDLASSLRNALREHRPPRPAGGRGASLHATGTERQEQAIAELRRKLRAHPCHGCSEREDHARWAERWWKLRRETDNLTAQIRGRTNTIAKTFDRVSSVLEHYGYVAPDADGVPQVTPAGSKLRRIYGERDLLAALGLEHGAFDDLDAVELACLATALVYQPKREERGLRPRMPSAVLDGAVDILIRQWSELTDLEEAEKLPLTGEPELGLVWPMYKWVQGKHLQVALNGTELAAGDFVRWSKQVIDLIDQLAKVPELQPDLRRRCREAIDLIRRGVVAYSAVSE